ncbi:MAG: FUSC family protein [Peptostreptococcaceae bacterium]
MNKKLVISKTITFICIVGFVIIFKALFGAENTLVGVTTVTAALMFLSKDLTLSPGKTALKFIAFNLFIGIAAALAASNMWAGLVINFVTMFIISYLLCYNLETPMYIPFSLQYLFLLYMPVDASLLPKRMVSLIVGALIIVLAQLISNRNRLATSGNKILSGVCDIILLKIKDIKEDNKKSSQASIKESINAFRKMVYDKREVEFYLTEEGRIKLNLSVALESIYTLLNKVEGETNLTFILDKLEKLINETKLILEDDHNKISLSNKGMSEFIKECENENISDLKRLQILDSMILLKDTIQELNELDESRYNEVKKVGEKPNYFKDQITKYIFRENKSLKYCYAMRVSILISIGAFIVELFNIPSGKWLAFTLLALTNPLYEVSKTKTSDRVIGTTIGVVIVTLLFTIFEDTTIRTLIIMSAGYIDSYITDYKYKMTCVTVSAVGSAAMVGDVVGEFALIRIVIVVVGAIIAITANKYLYPYSLKDSNEELITAHKNIVVKMLKEIYALVDGRIQPYNIKNLLISTSLIEEKLKINNQILDKDCYTKIVEEQRFLVANIYELYIWIAREKVNPKFVKYVLEDIDKLINYKDEEIKEMIEKIKEHIEESNDLKVRITLSSIVIMLQEFKVIEDLKAMA